ncbi:type I-E CRISPR-associated protein Cas5/CasD [Paracoccus lutimaris]|jgi:CRISPR system Cascade subunit CasD|uniref:CRISPR system Cascade subunit CasD n=1 Tax=Paracoccus lutimaris TaxID=1490030 RepID=A0A368YGI3_9RHOB|nr:type I-E CRISPR-associated protein Cas5/CasD [Paracoccus lutimaris]MBP6677645.1 type I-E CRISPR-associated protein Cas5/CasD [Paracoccus sp. (in: a-proteobacteria)]RCW78558.1 CRISPR system Cascade subunit CasD [Paracoccus lutimaris]
MVEHLVFTLCATLAANGDLAGHERRGTLTWPGRSAILGLLAAARGIRREDAAGLAALDALQTAVAIHDAGQPLRDYHTVQTVPSAAVKRPDSRSEALRRAGRAVNTALTQRDYRTGVLYAVAIWGLDMAPFRDALLRPVFTLYLGRKSCPLSVPPAPRLVQADDLMTALAAAQMPSFRVVPPAQAIYSDVALPGARVERRNDVALDRLRWHFSSRAVHVLHPQGAA